MGFQDYTLKTFFFFFFLGKRRITCMIKGSESRGGNKREIKVNNVTNRLLEGVGYRRLRSYVVGVVASPG